MAAPNILNNNMIFIAKSSSGTWIIPHGSYVNTHTYEFKKENNLTITGFATEVASYNYWSFPEEAKTWAKELLKTYAEFQKITADFIQTAKKQNKTIQNKVYQKGKYAEKLGQRQRELFDKIVEKIRDWYFPKSITKGHVYVGQGNRYDGRRYEWEGDTTTDKLTIPYSVRTANKFWFMAKENFDYLLPE